MNRPKPKAGVLVALIHELLKTKQFESRPDLVEAVKTSAARLRMRYDSELVGDAINQVERIRGSLFAAAPAVATTPATSTDSPPVSPDEARAFLEQIRRKLGTSVRPKTMPPARLATQGQTDQAKALDIVLAEIAETAARCDALEAEVQPEPELVEAER